MGVIRIPVSLKFDTESDFYNNFITDLRESRTLAGFIVDLLRAYDEDPNIKQLVNQRVTVSHPMEEIRKQIERIQLAHAKTVVTTSMLSNHNETIIDEAIDPTDSADLYSTRNSSQAQQEYLQLTSELSQAEQQPTSQQHQQPPTQQPVSVDSEVLNRLEKLEKLLPSLDDKFNQLLAMMQQGSTPAQQQQPPHQHPQGVADSSPTFQTHEEPTYARVEPTVTQDQKVEPTNYQPSISPSVDSTTQEIQTQKAPTITIEPPSLEPIAVGAPVMETDAPPVEEKPSRPASFGKAFKSIKKG